MRNFALHFVLGGPRAQECVAGNRSDATDMLAFGDVSVGEAQRPDAAGSPS